MRLANRTGKVIALGRLFLALFILAGIVPGIDGPVGNPRATLMVCAVYVAFATLMLALTWANWWREHRLRLLSHIVDMGFFLALDLVTGMPVTSPFFLFFVFLVLSATSSWGWRAALWTGAAVALLFAAETAFEIYLASMTSERYLYAVVRGGHLVVLSLMLSWFGLTHLSSRFALARSLPDDPVSAPPAERAVTYLADCLKAERAVLIWSEPDEPWLHITSWSAEGGIARDRAGPADHPMPVAEGLKGCTFLFDIARRRALVTRKRRLHGLPDCVALDPVLARRIDMEEGIATPLEAKDFHGYLFASGIHDMCWDDLPVARKAGLDISHAFDRWQATMASAEVRENEARLRVARDLHDGVAQIMAGIGLKLRAARTTTADAAQRDEELIAIENDLVAYQQQIHGFIENLRAPAGDGARVDLAARLSEVADRIRRQWPLEVSVTGDHLVSIPHALGSEIEYLAREGAANAVRHGKAGKLALAAEVAGNSLVLSMRDDGNGFDEWGDFDAAALAARGIGPRSIIERAQRLGGSVSLVSGERGALVTVRVPLRTDAE